MERIEPGTTFKASQLVYYPYFFFEYTLERKRLLHPFSGTTGCTIDAVDGIGSLIDHAPFLKNQALVKASMIQPVINSERGEAKAEAFIYDSISLKLKVLSMPKLKLNKKDLFYRPYWIVYGGICSNQFSLAVDAVTGKYHPL